MRMVWIILGLTLVALGLVHVRRREAALSYALQRTQSRHAELRREIWDRHVEIGRLTTPEHIAHRAAVMALDMTYCEPSVSRVDPSER
ncbi:MAG: hypothetical protein JXA11_00505 [Phycisphaerae bacterium]|nr:hypothetical protein [Phycisphaerae bacterium]